MKRKRRMYRDPKRRWIAGVCAAIAHHLGMPVFWVRLFAVLILLSPMFPLVVIAYIIAIFRIPTEPDPDYGSEEEIEFMRSVHSAPSATFGQVRHRMRDLEHRLRRMEAFVTSAEFDYEQGMKESK